MSQQLVLRARIILDCAAGGGSEEVVRTHGVSTQTVSKRRKRFAEGAPPRCMTFQDRKQRGSFETRRLRRSCKRRFSRPHEDKYTGVHDSSRRSWGVSQSSVSRIWRALNLKPHRQETFRLNTDDFFVEKVRDVVGIYMNPPEHAMVLCVDEKSQIGALERAQPVLPMVFGQPERKTP